MKNPELLSRITARPDIFGGKPIVRDMRISVELILSLLSQGVAQSEILDDYPELEPDDIRAVLRSLSQSPPRPASSCVPRW